MPEPFDSPDKRKQLQKAHDLIAAWTSGQIPEASAFLTQKEHFFLCGQLNALCFALGHDDESAQSFAQNIAMMRRLTLEWGYEEEPLN